MIWEAMASITAACSGVKKTNWPDAAASRAWRMAGQFEASQTALNPAPDSNRKDRRDGIFMVVHRS